MERILRDHIVDHMLRNGFFSVYQFGFIKGRSAVLQLLCALESWIEAIDEGNSVHVICADLRKAFDKVPHKRLLEKCRSYGFTEQIMSWLDKFLAGRKQRVLLNGVSSQWEDFKFGIPQGSVLGPLLFLIFINDLPEAVQSTIYLFADDSKIWRTIKDKEDSEILQQDLDKMQKWSEKWLMQYHPDKLKGLCLNNKETVSKREYTVGDVIIKKVTAEKNLGVTVDKDLKFKEHIESKISKGNQMLGVIRRTFQFLDNRMLKLLFKGIVRVHLEYAAPIWSPANKSNIENIETVQRRGTKVLPGMKDLTYEQRLRSLNLPTLRFRRYRGDMIEVFKIMKGIYDNQCLPPLKLKNELGRTRGHSLQLQMSRSRLELSRTSFCRRVVPI
eukprot:Seg96.8 transcript_id=Seg96.8/GoldUCD/mRNA.D3Y31 product="putative RNA-directed DNA polymerase from transposon BS" protein_id=Seg96.8/GoldUCD/D3Y31